MHKCEKGVVSAQQRQCMCVVFVPGGACATQNKKIQLSNMDPAMSLCAFEAEYDAHSQDLIPTIVQL